MSPVEYVVLAIVVVASFALLLHFRKGNRPGPLIKQWRDHFPGRKSSVATVGQIMPLIHTLRRKRALWPEIERSLNPDGDKKVSLLLGEIRGPHQFDPNTALGVIETGFAEVPAQAPIAAGLEAAVRSMNRIVRIGD